MKKKNMIYLTIAVVLVLLIAYGLAKRATAPGKYNAFAECLNSKGVVIYGTGWCPHCKEQKALFGKSFKYVNYVNCDNNRQECAAAGVRGYPTWVINGTSYPGKQALEGLSAFSGCSL